MYVEAINLDGSGHGLYQITGKSVSGSKCALFVTPVHSTGHPNGKAVVKIFKMTDADPGDYVKKTGGTITGPIKFDPDTTGNPLTIYANDDTSDRASVFSVYGKTQDDERRLSILSVVADGSVLLNTSTKLESSSATHKKYVDEKIAEEIAKVEKEEDETNAHLFGSPYIFRQDKKPEKLATGEFTYDSDKSWYAHRYDARGDRIGVSFEDHYTADGMFKVYKHNGSINLICIMHRFKDCKTGQSGNDHMKWVKRQLVYSHYEWLEDGEIYYISDGFLLP